MEVTDSGVDEVDVVVDVEGEDDGGYRDETSLTMSYRVEDDRQDCGSSSNPPDRIAGRAEVVDIGLSC